MDSEEIIRLLDLQPHPEGGYYRETYRSDEKISARSLPVRYKTDRCLSTAIYYLITSRSYSMLHRIYTDEMYHFYLGDPVLMLLLHPDGPGKTTVLGNDITAGYSPQCLVPSRVWQGLCLVEGGNFALMGTTVAPGFNFDDFELGARQELIEKYPGYANMIERLTTG